jgi:hypothetical protein
MLTVGGQRDEDDLRTRTGRLRGRWLLATGLGVALLGPKAALAIDGGTVDNSRSISPEYEAPRFMFGSDAGAPGHFENLGVESINYADCASAIDLQVTLDLTNPPPGDEIQVWAGSGSADCTQVSARSGAASATPNSFPGRCWPAAASNVYDPTKATTSARLHVRDLVASIGVQNPPTDYAPTTGLSVCEPLATNDAVQLNIYFIYVPAGSGTNGVAPAPVDGVSGLYSTVAALVGPFAPQMIQVPNSGITANSLMVNWVPQEQPSIVGYIIYAQDQGTTGQNNGVTVDGSSTLEMGVQCHPRITCDAGASSTGDAGDLDAGSDGAPADASHVDASISKDATVVDGAGATDATVVDAGGGAVACDAGFSTAWDREDAAAYSGMSEAGLAAMGCEYTSPVNALNPPTTNPTTCVSGVLDSLFQVDGGLGSIESPGGVDAGVVTVDTDAGTDGGVDDGAVVVATVDAGSVSAAPGTVPETAGISLIPSQYLVYYDNSLTDVSYTLPNLTTGHQYAIAVAAVDAYGNIGPVGNLGCSTPTPVEDFFMRYTTDGGTAGGGYCALGAVGAPAFGSVFGFGIAGSVVALMRRRRRARRKS